MPAAAVGDPEAVGLAEPEPLSLGAGESDDDPDADVLGDGGRLLGGGELGGGATADLVWVACADDGSDEGALLRGGTGLFVAAVGAPVLAADGASADAFALAEADAAAAEAEFSLTCADTPAGEMTRGVEPATSWPTRLTAVKVTAVTSAHDSAHPIASDSGRPDHPRKRATSTRRGRL